MKRTLAIAIALAASAIVAHAEPRWCSIIGREPNDKVFYPPIAKAARVYVVVLSYIIYQPNGKVERIEPISGPPMLSRFMANQLMDWNVKTDATGDELCQTLVIAKFELKKAVENPAPDPPALIDNSEPGILLLDLASNPATPVCLCDPAGRIVFNNPLQRLAYAVKRGFRRIFHGGQ